MHERLLKLPDARGLEGLPIATVKPDPLAPLVSYTFEGNRNADGSVGTRNNLAISQTVQCVAAVTDFAVQRIRAELLPVVSLGCEKLQPERLQPPGSFGIVDERQLDSAALDVVCLQDDEHVGFMSMVDPIGRQAEVHQLTARASMLEVAAAMIREMAWYDAYLQHGGADRSANTTPGNKAGGLSNIVEKAMGSIVKSGTAPISDVLAPGEKLRAKGLTYAATPASDFICGTLQLAAGMNLHVFTTGRGTPYGLAAVPVIKVATRSDLARRWHDLMDVNAGSIADGTATIEEVGWELFRLMLDVASGRKQTWAERWQLHNALMLFNPAPVT